MPTRPTACRRAPRRRPCPSPDRSSDRHSRRRTLPTVHCLQATAMTRRTRRRSEPPLARARHARARSSHASCHPRTTCPVGIWPLPRPPRRSGAGRRLRVGHEAPQWDRCSRRTGRDPRIPRSPRPLRRGPKSAAKSASTMPASTSVLGRQVSNMSGGTPLSTIDLPLRSRLPGRYASRDLPAHFDLGPPQLPRLLGAQPELRRCPEVAGQPQRRCPP